MKGNNLETSVNKTTTIRLGDLRQQVIELANLKCCSPHKIMLTAIRKYIETETKKQNKILNNAFKERVG